MSKGKILITGHKNPDTDSICAAIGYAYLKNKIGKDEYLACRTGQINEETKFVLEYFGLERPRYIKDVSPQVLDVRVEEVKPVYENISLKTAWQQMKEQKVNTIPVVNDDLSLDGVITVGDITKSYMEESDRTVIAKAKTPFENLVHTLEAEVLVPYKSKLITKGKLLVAAANPDVMEEYIDEGDIVIVGNRYESQLCAIEMNCSCIIVSYNSPVSKTIIKIAREKNCAVIVSPYDTFSLTRIINQSIPISFFMASDKIISFERTSYLKDIYGIMAKSKYRDYPIMEDGKYLGFISRRSLLDYKKKRVIMVDHNEKEQAVDGIEESDVLEIIDHHKIATLDTTYPIYFRNQPLGCTSTIIYQLFNENAVEIPRQIAGGFCSAIISDTLYFRSPTCTPLDIEACKNLAILAEIDLDEYSSLMFSAGSNMKNKTAEEIFFQDFKKFVVGKLRIGVGQINIIDKASVDEVSEKLLPYLEDSLGREKLDCIYFMMTDIFEESTYLIYVGDGAREIIDEGFDVQLVQDRVMLRKIVSRKKQFIPSIIQAVGMIEEESERER